jgi:hypothetical protein
VSEAHGLAAYRAGVDAARAAASWCCDGNTKPEAIAGVLAMLDSGDDITDYLPARPDLSGQWADEMNPRRLFEEITGWDAHAEGSWNADAYGNYVDALADAWERGVSDTFLDACESELRASAPEASA